jgi:hypothetical protein
MIPKSGYRFSEKIMLHQTEHDPEKPALGLDHRKSDVSDLRPCKSVRTREHPSSGGGYRFSEKIMLKSEPFK